MSMKESPSSASITTPVLVRTLHPLAEPMQTVAEQNLIVALAGAAVPSDIATTAATVMTQRAVTVRIFVNIPGSLARGFVPARIAPGETQR
jgi:hypothetical protein